MSRLCFFTNPWASGEIRGRQIGKRVGGVVDPKIVYPDDTVIGVKCVMDDKILESVSKVYIDVVDSYVCIPWLREHPNAGVIAISYLGGRYLRETLPQNDVKVIVEHHCNFERQRKEIYELHVAGYIGETENFQLSVDDMKSIAKSMNMSFIYVDKFKTREDIVSFYQSIDVQVTFRKDVDDYGKTTGMLKNPLKLANAGSFGIPTICYPEATTVDEWEGCFTPVKDTDEIVFWLDKMKQDSDFYKAASDAALARAERYHIDNVAPRYMQLLDNRERVMHDYTMNQLVNVDGAPSCNYPFEERVARRGGEHIDVDKSMVNLLDVANVCERCGIKMWLMFGTLLGAVRDKTLIPKSRDVDVGVFYSDFSLLADVLIDLKVQGFKLIRTDVDDSCVTVMRDDEYIDFYLFRGHDGQYICNQPGLNAKIHKHHFDVLDTVAIDSHIFATPSNSVALLKLWYGDDWMTPVDGVHAYGTR